MCGRHVNYRGQRASCSRLAARVAATIALMPDNCSFYNVTLQLSLLKSGVPSKEVEKSN